MPPKNAVISRSMLPITSVQHLSDSDLLAETQHLVRDEQQLIARLLALLGEVDARRLYLGQSCSSLFTYCTQILHLYGGRARGASVSSDPADGG